jgi:hypothetical protein
MGTQFWIQGPISRNQAEIEEAGKLLSAAAWSDHWSDFNPVACVLTASHDSQSELMAMAGDSRALLRSLEVPGCDPQTAPWGALMRGDPVCEIQGPIPGNGHACQIRETQEIAEKKTEETSQTAAARAQGKIPRALVPSQPQTAPQAL